MNFSKHLYQIFIASILVPGLILAYLSFRTVKDERILIEKSLETRNEEFAEAVQRLVEKIKNDHLTQLREQLRRSSSSSTPDNYLFLAADLLENPMMNSLAIFRQDEMVFPRKLLYRDDGDAAGAVDSLDLPVRAREAVAAIRAEYWAGRYLHAIRLARIFSRASESLFATRAGASYRYGLKLLEIKCLVNLNLTDEAVALGRDLIHALLRDNGFTGYHQVNFYLSEIVNLLTSLENLPHDVRDYFWSIHQRSEIFLVNAESVFRDWEASPDRLLRNEDPDARNPIRIDYLEGTPYLMIGYPWLDKETRIIAKLNESIFSAAIRDEIVEARKSAWKDMDFLVLDQRDRVVMNTDTLADRKVALEKRLSGEFPAWKLVIFRKMESEVSALGRKKLSLLYTLMAFALAALITGSWSVFQGLKKERKMVRMRSNFLSAVSHELKTPLTAIRMFAEILESGRQAQEEKRKRYASLIGQEAMRLHGMIEGILNFTKLEEKRSKLTLSPVNLSLVVQEVAGLMAGAYEKAGIKLSLRLDPDTMISGDYDSLRSVVQNLLENSLKYSPSATVVAVRLDNAPDKTELRVKDQGIGISGADLKHIFDKFYRAGDEMTRKTKGSGLGLSIVKQILDSHKAQIKVNSKVREGTEMIITFFKGNAKDGDGHVA